MTWRKLCVLIHEIRFYLTTNKGSVIFFLAYICILVFITWECHISIHGTISIPHFPFFLPIFLSFLCYYLFVSLQPTESSFCCSYEHIKSCPVESGKPTGSLTSEENWLFLSQELSVAYSSLATSRVSWDISPFTLVCSCASLVQVVCSWVIFHSCPLAL